MNVPKSRALQLRGIAERDVQLSRRKTPPVLGADEAILIMSDCCGPVEIHGTRLQAFFADVPVNGQVTDTSCRSLVDDFGEDVADHVARANLVGALREPLCNGVSAVHRFCQV